MFAAEKNYLENTQVDYVGTGINRGIEGYNSGFHETRCFRNVAIVVLPIGKVGPHTLGHDRSTGPAGIVIAPVCQS